MFHATYQSARRNTPQLTSTMIRLVSTTSDQLNGDVLYSHADGRSGDASYMHANRLRGQDAPLDVL